MLTDRATAALDPIRSLGAQLWVTELAPGHGRRRYQVDGWISDRRHRSGEAGTSVGFAFELAGDTVSAFELLVHARRLRFPDVTTVVAAVRKLRVAVKVIQGRILVANVDQSPAP